MDSLSHAILPFVADVHGTAELVLKPTCPLSDYGLRLPVHPGSE